LEIVVQMCPKDVLICSCNYLCDKRHKGG